MTISPSFISSVHGCAETEKGMATRSLIFNPDEIKISTEGQAIKFHHALNHQCCRKAELSHAIADNRIMIYETWSGEGCRCMCFSELDATLTGLPTGEYTVQIIERGTSSQGKATPEKIINEVKIQMD